MVSGGFRQSRVGAGLVAVGAVLLAANLVARGWREPGADGAVGVDVQAAAETRPGIAQVATEPRPGIAQVAGETRPGVEVLLADSIHLVEGRRAGLVTNHTGIDREGVSTIDLLHRDTRLELVALYSPEHGIRGQAEAGELVDSGVDPRTGLPIHSLYGATRKPTPEMLEGVEVLLFDIQDIGARYYTYVYTMALAMEAAGEAGIPLVVLDRPNPIGGVEVQGNVLDPAFASFVGMYPIPMRHGMTPGELARLFQGEFGVSVELGVAPLSGWSRSDGFGDTGLPWVAPSPNMPSVESARHYPGTCLFEGTNLSVGRGTPIAFQQIGAPWLDGDGAGREPERLRHRRGALRGGPLRAGKPRRRQARRSRGGGRAAGRHRPGLRPDRGRGGCDLSKRSRFPATGGNGAKPPSTASRAPTGCAWRSRRERPWRRYAPHGSRI